METLMDEVCGYLHNYFLVKPDGIHRGFFTISNGTMEADFLQENQYFRVRGSVFNDGVWKYPTEGMTDEEFTGEVWAMAVPPAFISILEDIETWNTKYGGADSINMSPFQSESFNNYSYSKGSNSRSGSAGTSQTPTTWKDVFLNRLSRWRKL